MYEINKNITGTKQKEVMPQMIENTTSWHHHLPSAVQGFVALWPLPVNQYNVARSAQKRQEGNLFFSIIFR